jgi:hypothetical protein
VLGDQQPPPSDSADPATPLDPPEHTDQAKGTDLAESAARRRRLADVFGDVLPEVTEDDTPDRATRGGQPANSAERWYRENRPPHHDQG